MAAGRRRESNLTAECARVVLPLKDTSAGPTCRAGSLRTISPSTLAQNRHEQTDPFLPGRGQADPAPGDALAVLQQGDLPARADLQRVGCLRQAAFRGARQRGLVRRRADARSAGAVRRRRQDADDPRQRHRHEPRRGDRAPGHHRQERHPRIRGQARRRTEEGRQPDRAVRRGLLFGLHRRRPHHGGNPSRGPIGRPGRALDERGHRRLRGRGDRPRGSAAPT